MSPRIFTILNVNLLLRFADQSSCLENSASPVSLLTFREIASERWIVRLVWLIVTLQFLHRHCYLDADKILPKSTVRARRFSQNFNEERPIEKTICSQWKALCLWRQETGSDEKTTARSRSVVTYQTLFHLNTKSIYATHPPTSVE